MSQRQVTQGVVKTNSGNEITVRRSLDAVWLDNAGNDYSPSSRMLTPDEAEWLGELLIMVAQTKKAGSTGGP